LTIICNVNFETHHMCGVSKRYVMLLLAMSQCWLLRAVRVDAEDLTTAADTTQAENSSLAAIRETYGTTPRVTIRNVGTRHWLQVDDCDGQCLWQAIAFDCNEIDTQVKGYAKLLKKNHKNALFKVQKVNAKKYRQDVQSSKIKEYADGKPNVVMIRTDKHPQSLLDWGGHSSPHLFKGRATDMWKTYDEKRWWEVDYHGLFSHDDIKSLPDESSPGRLHNCEANAENMVPIGDSESLGKVSESSVTLEVSFREYGSHDRYLVDDGRGSAGEETLTQSQPLPSRAKWYIRLEAGTTGGDLTLTPHNIAYMANAIFMNWYSSN